MRSRRTALRPEDIWKQPRQCDILSGPDLDLNKLDHILGCERISLLTSRPRLILFLILYPMLHLYSLGLDGLGRACLATALPCARALSD